MDGQLDHGLLDVLMTLQAAIDRVGRVTDGRDLRDMLRDELMQLGITKAVEQVGEISGRILRKFPDFAAAHPELELKSAYDARNRLSHGYETLDFESVWLSATVSVGRMRSALAERLAADDDRP